VLLSRGRPRKNGAKSWPMLRRSLLILLEFDRARRPELKHSAAIAETVAVIRRKYRDVRVSETEVKRTLAEWRPRNRATTYLAREPENPGKMHRLDGLDYRVIVSLYVGPRPVYPRINQKTPRNSTL
jgi:hypothetical protein